MSDALLAEVQERLGVTFRDPALLQRALTHPSWAEEHGDADYERLEFLGDSVLGFIVADLLHERFPDLPEGDLTRMKTSLVRKGTLSAAARSLRLDDAIRSGKGAAGARDRDSVLEACFEAVLAAVYLDRGLEEARGLVSRALAGDLDAGRLSALTSDPKNALQERTQAAGSGLPSYRIVSEEGPVHERLFAAEVLIGSEVLGRGEGESKQAAERRAAAAALDALAREGKHSPGT